jgi:hypothetical protein
MSYKSKDDTYDDVEDRKKANIHEDSYFMGNDDDEEIDNSVKELSAEYEFYDNVCKTHDEIVEYTKTQCIPLCEYLTTHNLLKFIEEI